MAKYELTLKFKTGDIFSGVREMEDSVNDFMSKCGFHEKMFCQTEAPMLTFEVGKVLDQDELKMVQQTINENLAKRELKMECTRIERIA